MRLVFFIFLLLILGIIFSKFKINIKEIAITNKNKKVNIEISIYIFFILKILVIRINSENMMIFKHKIKIEKLKKKIVDKIDVGKLFDNVLDTINIRDLKLIQPEINKAIIYLEYSCNNVLLTTYLTPIISTVIGMIFSLFIKKYNKNNFIYKLNPQYINKKYFYIKMESIIDINLRNIINIIIRKKITRFVRRIKKYERTSYRRINDNSYE